MKRNLIVSIGIIFILLFLTGCIEQNERGTWIKTGKVMKIKSDVPFGGTFSDWRDDLYFDDGVMISSQERDLSSIELNRTGRFYFDKNYFNYDGREYKFDNFIRVEYLDDLKI